jgi:hypothetical protein
MIAFRDNFKNRLTLRAADALKRPLRSRFRARLTLCVSQRSKAPCVTNGFKATAFNERATIFRTAVQSQSGVRR